MTICKTILSAALATTALAGHASAEQLRMSWWGGDSRHLATQEALKVCGEKHGHTISPEFTGFSGHLEKLTTQIAGGTEADILQVNWPWLPLFSINGDGLADLNQYSDIIDLPNWAPELRATGTMNGKLNGLPVSTTGRVFMFNKTTFDKAGLPLPATWEDVFAAAPVFKDKLGADFYPLDATTLNALLIVSNRITQQTGKDLIDPATNQVAWTADELVQGLEFYQSLVDHGVVKSWKDSAGSGIANLFENPEWSNGKIAGSYEWDSTYFKYSDPLAEGQELVPVRLLGSTDKKTEGVYRKPSMVVSISAHSRHPEAAAQILNCLLNEPEGIAALGDTRGLPASKAAVTLLEAAGAIDPTLKAANEIVMAGTGPGVSPLNEHPDVRGVFQDTLEAFAYGQVDAATAAQEIVDGINEALEDFAS